MFANINNILDFSTIARKIFCEEKPKYPDKIVFVQSGDYFQTFHADAQAAKKPFHVGSARAGMVTMHRDRFSLHDKSFEDKIVVIYNPIILA